MSKDMFIYYILTLLSCVLLYSAVASQPSKTSLSAADKPLSMKDKIAMIHGKSMHERKKSVTSLSSSGFTINGANDTKLPRNVRFVYNRVFLS